MKSFVILHGLLVQASALPVLALGVQSRKFFAAVTQRGQENL
jgi:hypothetical protein